MTTVGDTGTLADRTVALGRALQAAGVNVSLSEIIDAARATTEIDLARRSELHAALRATLVKQARHYPTFEWAFDRYFPARLVRADDDDDGATPKPGRDRPRGRDRRRRRPRQRSPPHSSTSTPASRASCAPSVITCNACSSPPTSPA